jgi:hypothetical protein
VGGQGHAQGEFHDLFVEHRQNPGHAQADRAGMGVGWCAEFGGAAAENFGGGFELGMDFQADDRFELHGWFPLSLNWVLIDIITTNPCKDGIFGVPVKACWSTMQVYAREDALFYMCDRYGDVH